MYQILPMSYDVFSTQGSVRVSSDVDALPVDVHVKYTRTPDPPNKDKYQLKIVHYDPDGPIKYATLKQGTDMKGIELTFYDKEQGKCYGNVRIVEEETAIIHTHIDEDISVRIELVYGPR